MSTDITMSGLGLAQKRSTDAVDPISIRQRANSTWDTGTRPIEFREVSQNSSWSEVAVDLNTVTAEDTRLRKVLGHGYVRLVDYMGSDLSVVRAARVSYDAEWRAGQDSGSDARLIKYLINHQHTSPFEHVTFTWEVKAPIFVLRQWHRHRTWSYNEVSARYTELPEEVYIPTIKDITCQSSDNKQMRTDTPHPEGMQLYHWIQNSTISAFVEYKRLLKKGCPRELARMVLPLNTYSHMFATVNLHNLLKFITLRNHEHAQYEIRVYAEAMLDLIKPIVPVCVEAYMEQQNVAKGVKRACS